MNPDVVYVSGKHFNPELPTYPIRFVNLTPAPVKVIGYISLDAQDWLVRIVRIPGGESIITSAEVGQDFFANTKDKPIIFKGESTDDCGYVLRVTREKTSSAAASPLKDLCKTFTLKSVERSISKIKQLPLPNFMIVQLMQQVETPSDFVRAEKMINAWID